MIYGIDNYDKLRVLRPVWDTHECDSMKMPIVKAFPEEQFDFERLRFLNIQNISSKKSAKGCVAICFNYDNRLEKFWNDPLKYIPKLQKAAICCTPDYSIYPSMNYWQIAHNTFKNRWLGCLWQDYGITVISTISWANPDTYDICFSGVEQGSIVAISTLGCTDTSIDAFLNGYNNMMKRIKPSLVIVFGEFIEGLYGRLLIVKYEESFNNSSVDLQPTLFDIPKVIEITEAC